MVAFFLAVGCAERANVVRLEAPAPPALVARGPYLVELSDSTAVIRWSTRRALPSGVQVYAADDTIVGRANGLRRSHTFRLRGLHPRARYTYRILLADSTWSSPVTFTTFPRPGKRAPVTFLVIGDTGSGGPDQLRLARVLNREEAGFLLHVGDIAYPAGTVQTYSDRFFAVYRPLLARAAFFPVPGNHDLWLGERAFVEAFTPPGGRASGSPFHYAFTVGNARFIALQAEGNHGHGSLEDVGSAQHRWLVQELRTADGDPRIDWIIIYLHRPLYSASTGPFGYGSDLDLRAALRPLFDMYGADLVFAGHDHDYQRSKPIRSEKVVEPGHGTVYYVTGGGGGLMSLRGVEPEWFTARAEEVFHFLRVRLDGGSIQIEAVNDRGVVFDRLVLELEDAARTVPTTDRRTAPTPRRRRWCRRARPRCGWRPRRGAGRRRRTSERRRSRGGS